MKQLAGWILLCAVSVQAQDTFKGLLAKASQGDLQSEIAIGDAYNFGRGAGINYRKAEEWYKSAAGQGSGYAAYQIGMEYQLDHRPQTRGLAHIPYTDPVYNMQMARIYMLQSATLGYGPGYAWMGWYCEEGYRMGQSVGDSSSVATIQEPQHQSTGGGFIGGLAQGIAHGNGDDQTVIRSSTSTVGGANYSEAATWYSKGAEAGDIQSELGLGRLYEQGLGVLKKPKLAIRYYEKAMLQGSPDGEAKYKLLVEQYGVPSPDDVELPTAACVDGTYSFSHQRSGACADHQGVKKWIEVKPNP
ncbi:MAG: tetratricopeptide repeat protein [Terracidiphilus sp.]|nr:tetratricopeptide repeat protein [Terracidiphilus sp.]